MKVIVVGAGVAGLTAARGLVREGHEVQVFEAAPGPGGRLATGELAGGPIDEGALRFSVRTPDFHARLAPLVAEGAVRLQQGRTHRWRDGRLEAPPLTSGVRLWEAPDGMARLASRLADGLDVRGGCRVTGLSATDGRWRVKLVAHQEEADAVVIALPAPEALTLALTAPEAFAPSVLTELGRVVFEPALVMVAAFPRLASGWSSVEAGEGAVVRLDARHAEEITRVVVQASADWSRQAFNRDDPSIIEALLTEAARMTGTRLHSPQAARVVRWRHAWPSLLAPARCLLSPGAAPAVFCGDWCVGPRVEGAFLSGSQAAERLSLSL